MAETETFFALLCLLRNTDVRRVTCSRAYRLVWYKQFLGVITMPKNIVLLSDGTGNSAGKLTKMNVWRLYQALDLSLRDRDSYDSAGC